MNAHELLGRAAPNAAGSKSSNPVYRSRRSEGSRLIERLESRTLMSTTYDAATGFSATKNPNPPWTYGYSTTETSSLIVYTTVSGLSDAQGIDSRVPSWHAGTVSAPPYVYENTTKTSITDNTITIGAGQLAEHPGASGEYSHIRFTAPAAGNYSIAVTFTGIDHGGPQSSGGTSTDVHVLYDGKSLFDGAVNGYGATASKTLSIASVAKGATIDFIVGDGANKTYYDDSTAVSATITQSTAVTTGTITGTVFHDVNGNGTKDTGDPALSGWTVFLDTNKNGKLDPGETSTTTNSTGGYTFSNVPVGAYQLSEVVKSGWKAVSPSTGYFAVTVAAGATISKNFADAVPVSFSGTVFNDSNLDGIKESTETGLSGWKVYIDANNNGKLDTGELTATTASNGTFSFTGLNPGTYLIRIVAPTGYTATSEVVESVTLLSGWALTGINFGFVKA